MSTKVLKKELMAAVAMVLVALIALSGSTYAWFAQNTEVTAKTMTVNAATASPYLQIKQPGDTEFSTAVIMNEASASLAGLKLVSPEEIAADGTVTWFKSTSNNPNLAVTGNSTSAATDGSSEYMVKQGLILKNASNIQANDLTVSIALENVSPSSIDQALRVLLVTSDGAYALFDSTATITEAGIASASKTTLAATLLPGEELGVSAYMYFDGTDEKAKSAVLLSDKSVKCTLTFKILD